MGNSNSQRRTSGDARSVGGAVSPSGRSALLGNIRPTNPDRLRVLWYSNAPWAATGYGQQTAQVIQRLAKEDHQVAVHAMYGLAGSVSTWNGFKMYPQGLATYSDDVVVAHTMEWASQDLSTPTLLITLFGYVESVKTKKRPFSTLKCGRCINTNLLYLHEFVC